MPSSPQPLIPAPRPPADAEQQHLDDEVRNPTLIARFHQLAPRKA